MTKQATYARLDADGNVVEVFAPLTIEVPDMDVELVPDEDGTLPERPMVLRKVPIEERFTSALVATLVEVPDGTRPAPPPVAKYTKADARAQRDRLIAASDWSQLDDVAKATKDVWKVYRQALRDVPQQPGFPDAITWPIAPT